MRISAIQSPQMQFHAAKNAPAATGGAKSNVKIGANQVGTDKVDISGAGRKMQAQMKQAAGAVQDTGRQQGARMQEMTGISTDFSERSGVTFGGKG